MFQVGDVVTIINPRIGCCNLRCIDCYAGQLVVVQILDEEERETELDDEDKYIRCTKKGDEEGQHCNFNPDDLASVKKKFTCWKDKIERSKV